MSGSGTTLIRGISSKSRRTGPGQMRGRGRHIRFAGFNVLFDSEGNYNGLGRWQSTSS